MLHCSLLLLALVTMLPCILAHGVLVYPPPRGILTSRYPYAVANVDSRAPLDYRAHYPAGDKSDIPGAGFRSQVAAVAPHPWTPFDPYSPAFRWRTGVCGDTPKGSDHLRGGRFYHNATRVARFKRGQTVEPVVNIVAHHNGFFEFHLCDVRRCGGEVSHECFQNKHCTILRRAASPGCETGAQSRCGPVDLRYPGRWYVPCSTVPYNTPELFGGTTMKYQLPSEWGCEHCVLVWYWTAANTCNPKGVKEYFQSGRVKWGECRGQGGAVGGWARGKSECGKVFPEEYMSCSDISIE